MLEVTERVKIALILLLPSYARVIFLSSQHQYISSSVNVNQPVQNWVDHTKLSTDTLYSIIQHSSNLLCLLGYNMQDLSTHWLHCDPGPLFKPESYILPGWIPHWMVMAVFAYIYHQSFVVPQSLSVEMVLDQKNKKLYTGGLGKCCKR